MSIEGMEDPDWLSIDEERSEAVDEFKDDLIAKLEAEIETTELGLTDLEVAVRRGWNNRSAALIAWLKEGAQ